MKLVPGARLGPYEIIALLGSGGMGEVYSARDTRLGRIVAIKIVSPEFAQRFEREAKAISALNHPHICALYDVGPNYLVMEYCEGKTLAQYIAGRPLPIEEVIEYGMEIADALDKAHRAGIIHRDLKPSNIMITKSGVKLLDFGLAKQQAASAPDDSTLRQLTEEGMILGTIPYMAPERLHGEEADARSDIFALGVVLYEMATGKPAFSGSTKASLFAAILEHDPPPAGSSSSLDRLINACLAKDPDERIQSASDVKMQLRWIADEPETQASAPRRSKAMNRAVPLALVAATVATIVAVYVAMIGAPEPPMRAAISLPPGMKLGPALGAVALSPDGGKVAMMVGPLENTTLAVYDFRSGETKVLTGTDMCSFPFWSPDGRRLGFFAHGKLKTIDANGGAVQIVCDAPLSRGGAWSPHGVIVFTPNVNRPILKVSEAGGTPIAVTRPKEGWSHYSPVFLPDGQTFLYLARPPASTDPEPGSLYAGSIATNLEKRVVDHASNAAYVDGHILFVRNRNVVAQRFDVKTLAVSGTPTPIADGVEFENARTLGNFSATNRILLYVPDVPDPQQIASVDPVTRQADPIGSPAEYGLVDVSRDGRKAAVTVGLATPDIWIMPLDRGIPTRATFNASLVTALFSPDGNRLAYVASTDRIEIRIQSLDGNGSETALDSAPRGFLRAWSADGQKILMSTNRGDSGIDIESLDIREHKLTPLLDSQANENDAALSPDDRWVAYTSDESGSPQVYVASFPDLRGKWRISSEIGIAPKWSSDGKQLYFVSRGRLNVVDVRGGSQPEFSMPTALPISIDAWSINSPGYALTPQGRIITAGPAGEPPQRSIHLITNWTKLLPR